MTSGTLPKGWKDIELGDALKRIKRPVEVDPSMMYREIGIRSHGKGIFHKEERTGESIGEKSVFWVEPDCFIVNIVFAWEQAIAKTSTNEIGMIASHRFPMYKPARDILDLDYLVYFFQSPRGKYLLGLASPGGAGRNKTLGQEEFLNLSVSLPSYLEQRKIVEILASWDNAIALTESLIFAKQQKKRGIAQQLLTGNKRFDEYKTHKWDDVRFSDVINISIGRTPPRDNPNYWDTNKSTKNIWLSIRDLQSKYITDSKEYLSDLGIQVSNARLLPIDTVIMSFKLTIGKAGILAAPAYTNEAICALIPKDDSIISSKYLYHALSVVRFDYEIDQAIKGKTLNIPKLERLVLPLPSLKEQKKIADFIDLLDDEIELIIQKLNLLKQQKKGLMQKLLTGQIRVKV